MFGPTNINFWRIAMEADGDSPGRAVEIARMRNPIIVETVRSLLERSRRGAGWTELRGLCERLGIG